MAAESSRCPCCGQPTPPLGEPFIPIPEVAALMGITEEAVRVRVRAGSLPGLYLHRKNVKVPRLRFFHWLQGQTAPPEHAGPLRVRGGRWVEEVGA